METMIKKRLLIIIVFLTVLFIPSSFATIPSDFIHHWGLNLSLNDYNNTINLQATTPQYTSGKFANASLFSNSANNRIYNSTASPVDYNALCSGFAISLWVNFSTVASGSYYGVFYSASKDPSTANYRQYGIDKINGGANDLRFFFHGNAGTANVASTITPVANTTYHVVGTFDGTKARIYVNNVLKTTSSAITCTGNSGAGSYNETGIGGYGVGTSGGFFNGWVDSVYVYQRNLTALDVENLYNATSDYAPPAPPVADNISKTFIIKNIYDGSPLSGIVVNISNSTHSYINTTNSTGGVYFNLHSGTYTINISHSSYLPYVNTFNDNTTQTIYLNTGFANFTIKDQYNNFISNIPFIVYNDNGTSFVNGTNVLLKIGSNTFTIVTPSYYNKTVQETYTTSTLKTINATNLIFKFPQQFKSAYVFYPYNNTIISDVNNSVNLNQYGNVYSANYSQYIAGKYTTSRSSSNYLWNEKPILNSSEMTTKGWTISMRVKFGEINDGVGQWIFDSSIYGSNGSEIFFFKDDDSSKNYSIIAGVWGGGSDEIELGMHQQKPVVGVTYHLVLRYNMTALSFYVDGVKVDENTTASTLPFGLKTGGQNGTTLFGIYVPPSATSPMHGNISSVYVYPYALNDANCPVGAPNTTKCGGEIADIYYSQYDYYGLSSPADYFRIYAYDYYTNLPINEFNANIYSVAFYSTGGLNPQNANDDDYNTFALSASGVNYYYWNYTLISNTSTLIWQVKDFYTGVPTTVNLSNISQNCKNQNPLQLRAKSENAGGFQYTAEWSCYNGSSFESLRLIEDSISNNRIYEQSLFENGVRIYPITLNQYNTSIGVIVTDILKTDNIIKNITVYSNYSQGYFNRTHLNYNTGSDLSTQLNKTFVYYTVSNNVSYNNTNYVRNLSYTLSIENCYNDSLIMRFINGVNDYNQTFSCVNQTSTVNGNYIHSTETLYNIFFAVPSTYNYNYYYGNTFANTSNISLISDLYAPIVVIDYTLSQGFTTTPNTTISLTCQDTVNYYNLTYVIKKNNDVLFNGSRISNTTQSNTTNINEGSISIYGSCTDFFSTNETTTPFNAYVRTLLLYDELFYIPFDIIGTGGNIGARAWFGDNSSVYDFKANNRNNISFVTNSSKIRVQINYSTTDEVVRYLDLDLITDSTIRVCTNRNPTTHYEQIALSASEKAIIIKNVYAQCYVAGDYTRFAYQEAFSLKYFTVNSLYYAYTWSDGVQTLLASVDGSIQSFFNIDTIEFNRDSADLELTNDYVSIQKTGNSQINIYYKNPLGNNDDITASIYYAINNSLAFATSSFTNMSEWFLLFDYSTLPNATNTTQWKLVIVAERNDKTYTTTKYFDGTGSLGFLNSKLAFTLAVLFLIFGFTMTATNYTFGWFGVLIGLATMFILALAVSTWYILMLQALSAVLILYCIILLTIKNYVTVA